MPPDYGYVQRVRKGHVSNPTYGLQGRTTLAQGIGSMANVAKRRNSMLTLLAAGVDKAGEIAGAGASHLVNQHQQQSAKDFNDEPTDRIAGSWGDGRVAKEPGTGWGPPAQHPPGFDPNTGHQWPAGDDTWSVGSRGPASTVRSGYLAGGSRGEWPWRVNPSGGVDPVA
jgi:hypothetical protein